MAFRLKLIPDGLKINYFRFGKIWFGFSMAAVLASLISVMTLGLNFGIDFLGGTTIRAESSQPVDVGAYRAALAPLNFGDVVITEVFDPSFGAQKHVVQIRIQAQDEAAGVTDTMIAAAQSALQAVDPAVSFTSVETVGPKVSGELIQTAFLSLGLALLGVMVYVWLRFEWQFGVAAVAALAHDAIVTIGLFSVLGLKFDLTIVAAVLTIVGYSINDTVVIFDRVRELLVKYRQPPLREIINTALNETMSRTIMTTMTTFLALLVLSVFGGDVIRGFSVAMLWGVFVGCYSTIFVASMVLLMVGVKRDWGKPTEGGGGDSKADRYAHVDRYVAERFGAKSKP